MKSDLIEISKPIMENLYKFVAGTGFLVILADEQGYHGNAGGPGHLGKCLKST